MGIEKPKETNLEAPIETKCQEAIAKVQTVSQKVNVLLQDRNEAGRPLRTYIDEHLEHVKSSSTRGLSHLNFSSAAEIKAQLRGTSENMICLLDEVRELALHMDSQLEHVKAVVDARLHVHSEKVDVHSETLVAVLDEVQELFQRMEGRLGNGPSYGNSASKETESHLKVHSETLVSLLDEVRELSERVDRQVEQVKAVPTGFDMDSQSCSSKLQLKVQSETMVSLLDEVQELSQRMDGQVEQVTAISKEVDLQLQICDPKRIEAQFKVHSDTMVSILDEVKGLSQSMDKQLEESKAVSKDI